MLSVKKSLKGVKELAGLEKTKKEKNFWEAVQEYFVELGKALAGGNITTKLSTVFMGLGHIFNYQYVKGILVFAIQALFVAYLFVTGIPNLSKFDTLGTVKREAVFDPLTLQNTVNDYDNSFMILLSSVSTIFIIILFVLFWIANIKNIYKIQKKRSLNKHVNSIKEDIKDLVGKKFHLTLLSLPVLGVILMNIIPILILIAVAFTNYDQNHMPPNELFTWIGFRNFVKLFGGSVSSSFGYAFRKVLNWTFVWAFLATFTTFIGGILMAQLINSTVIKYKRFWRSLFVISIAVPQFVTLLLVRNFFADSGIVNSICASCGITKFLQDMGLVSRSITYIPFLTSPNWAKFMIVMINIWVGIPYQMLIATGVLMNIPKDQIEAAKIDRASPFQIFRNITLPYILFIQGPALISDFVRNINNFGVIYLLTQDVYVTTDQALANAHAKEVDLLVTWLFRLTQEYYDYKMASVIGIIVFIICSVFTIISFTRVMAGDREETYQ
ncbi:MAG: sugar ABC transporter permease [Butyrivibrio sp.]|nr:sugar ABC transporter permease [Butyrivibrio sp.]